MVQFQDKDRRGAGPSGRSLPSILEALAEGALPPLPKLSDGAGAQAQWLAQLLKSTDELNPLQGTHPPGRGPAGTSRARHSACETG